MTGPVLGTKSYTEDGNRHVLKVRGGLHYIKGNSSPYFSITGDLTVNRRWDSGGCLHDLILQHFPQFADLVALHLSGIDGQPMCTLENGFYHLGGTHWQPVNIPVAAKHFRISETEAEDLLKLFGPSFSRWGGFLSEAARKQGKTALAKWVDDQRPRWKHEAEQCIERHGLQVYGDKWSD